MADEMMTVKLTLRKPIAERLRAMCHTKGLTASLLVDRWIFEHDDAGDILPSSLPKTTLDHLKDLLGLVRR